MSPIAQTTVAVLRRWPASINSSADPEPAMPTYPWTDAHLDDCRQIGDEQSGTKGQALSPSKGLGLRRAGSRHRDEATATSAASDQ